MVVLVDGGIRSGVDVLKMLALGADAVLVGRPLAVAAVGGGAEGVRLQLEEYAEQLHVAMMLTGCSSISEVLSLIHIFHPGRPFRLWEQIDLPVAHFSSKPVSPVLHG